MIEVHNVDCAVRWGMRCNKDCFPANQPTLTAIATEVEREDDGTFIVRSIRVLVDGEDTGYEIVQCGDDGPEIRRPNGITDYLNAATMRGARSEGLRLIEAELKAEALR